MAPLQCSDPHHSSNTNLSTPQAHPKDLCGTWKYEYKSPYSPYGNQHIQEVYTLLSCGGAHYAMIDKYDEGKDYFSETRTSGWGRWFVETNGEVTIYYSTVTASSVGGSVCGNEEPSWTASEHSSSSQLRESRATFVEKYKKQRSLDDSEEANFRTQMRNFLENLPPQPETELQGDLETSEFLTLFRGINKRSSPCRARCASKASSPPVQKLSALSGLRLKFFRSKRQCS